MNIYNAYNFTSRVKTQNIFIHRTYLYGISQEQSK